MSIEMCGSIVTAAAILWKAYFTVMMRARTLS